ncbi:MAG: transcription termination/antitermination protein NusG [Lachnospiraceae bacterium]
MAEAKWYVVHTYSGYENKVKADIDKAIENRHLEDQILEVSVPMIDVPEMKNGEEVISSKKLFPGYVLIHMFMNDDTWYVVRNTRGVTGFVGPGSKPVPLTEEEIQSLGVTQNRQGGADYAIGDEIKVVSGAWEGTVGVIKTVDSANKAITIDVEIFGRSTAVEIAMSDIRKM